ncbi:TerY-C metal binding domain-containing protein [Chryseobacterium sp. JV274]|uniref:TerY-C metal binding domain-containing protein n=1 Tax=Chryseobacterium sp. JV274 TaxID=1932669 RepID=UPI0009862F94|nr:TerY-C metal binding domain-containing protein [Chryseobacterium sp. JV274]
MRRLPIYFLVDISESMVGEPIEQVQEGIANIIRELKKDPYSLETVYISVIGFAGEAEVITPMQDIISFYPPKIPIGSGTSLSQGLIKVMDCIDRDIVKTTYERKGDWKPIVFLFTDGVPTDDATKAIERWNNKYNGKSNTIAVSIGENTNYKLLGSLADNVLLFNNSDENSYKEFFKWVTDSIKTTSQSVTEAKKEGINLSKIDSLILEKVDPEMEQRFPDNNFVVLNGKCQETEKLYLMKFKKAFAESSIPGMATRYYRLDGAYKIDEKAYYRLSSNQKTHLKINIEELDGGTSCPHCANPIALATCSCGGIHCLRGEGYSKCPWCGTSDYYGFSGGGFDINRTLG